MSTITWTLWLVMSGTILGQGGGPAPTATPVATYDSHEDCLASLAQIYTDTENGYGKKNPPRFPGFFFCVKTVHRK